MSQKSEIDKLTNALRAAIETLAADDPCAAREAVQGARTSLDDAEGSAIRAALLQCGWRVQPAAELLGFPRHSALQKLLEPGRRHETIGHEIDRQRNKLGYHGGRPPHIEMPPMGQKVTSRRGKTAPRG